MDVTREHVVAIAAKGVVTSEPSAIGAEVAASQPDEGSSRLMDVIREHVAAIAAKRVGTSEPSAIGAEVAALQPDEGSSRLMDVIREHVAAVAAKPVVTSEPSATGAEVAASQPDEGSMTQGSSRLMAVTKHRKESADNSQCRASPSPQETAKTLGIDKLLDGKPPKVLSHEVFSDDKCQMLLGAMGPVTSTMEDPLCWNVPGIGPVADFIKLVYDEATQSVTVEGYRDGCEGKKVIPNAGTYTLESAKTYFAGGCVAFKCPSQDVSCNKHFAGGAAPIYGKLKIATPSTLSSKEAAAKLGIDKLLDGKPPKFLSHEVFSDDKCQTPMRPLGQVTSTMEDPLCWNLERWSIKLVYTQDSVATEFHHAVNCEGFGQNVGTYTWDTAQKYFKGECTAFDERMSRGRPPMYGKLKIVMGSTLSSEEAAAKLGILKLLEGGAKFEHRVFSDPACQETPETLGQVTSTVKDPLCWNFQALSMSIKLVYTQDSVTTELHHAVNCEGFGQNYGTYTWDTAQKYFKGGCTAFALSPGMGYGKLVRLQ